MSDAPPPVRAEATPERRPAGPLTPERIDAILADFRAWLEALRDAPDADTSQAPEPVDLHTLAAQFTALRHEVNLQTRATRAATEQTAETLRRLDQPRPEADAPARPLVLALVDVADALAVALRQVERARNTTDEFLADVSGSESLPGPPGVAPPSRFLARLFGAGASWDAFASKWIQYSIEVESAFDRRAEKWKTVLDRLRPILAGVADGYALSLNRVERVLPQFGVEPIDCAGELFDPETMEVLEVVDAPGQPTGTVVEEVRRGYRWGGKRLRFAQVKVAR
jgi:molecular chaperone GrpE